MINPRFVTIHSLHSYCNALINRDDSGMAKRTTFGGSIRTRISSQCRKRHWNDSDSKYSMQNLAEESASYRSRHIVERLIIDPLKEELEPAEPVVTEVQNVLLAALYSTNGVHNVEARQAILLGEPEVNYLVKCARNALTEHPEDPEAAAAAAREIFDPKGANFRAFLQQVQNAAGTRAALFGRMSTSDHYAAIDGAIHVNHAFTVHAEETESDYFSSLDDLANRHSSSRPQSAHIGQVEINSGIFYGCVVVDVPQLVSNLEGCSPKEWHQADRNMASKAVHNLIRLVHEVTPAAKLGSTAAYSRSEVMLVETGDTMPINYGNAFRVPSEPTFEDAAYQLAQYMTGQDNMSGLENKRRLACSFAANLPDAEQMNITQLAEAVQNAVRAGVDE